MSEKKETKNNIDFSIVIPVYNEEEFLEKCLQCCFAQKGNFNFEVIVVDNNSTDNSVEIAKNFPVKILYEKMQSVGATRRLGTGQARGDIIINIDADTRLPIDFLSQVYDRFQKNKKLVCVGAQATFYDGSLLLNLIRPFLYYSLEFITRVLSFGRVGPLCNSMAFKKTDYDKVFGFKKEITFGEDANLTYQLSRFGKIKLDMSLECQISARRFVFDRRLWEYFKKWINVVTGDYK